MSYNTHSAISVADYIIKYGTEKGLNFTPMQLIKLVYLSHGWMLGLCGRPLIKESIAAWQYGPVIPNLYAIVKEYRAKPITTPLYYFDEGFDEAEKSIMKQVVDIYGQFSGEQLSQLTHEPGTPWSMVWSHYGRNHVIPNSVIQQHFEFLAKRNSQYANQVQEAAG